MQLQKLDEVTVSFDDGSQHKVLCSSMLWNMYRGSSGISVPNLLESIHMAIEKYLLDQLEGEEKKKNIERVRDTSLWKFTGYACSIKVNFSPCVMTGAVLAKVVFGTPGGCAGCFKMYKTIES